MSPAREVPLPSGAALLELIRVMDRLRSPGGCPWDAEQTHRSLITYLIEETYEAVEAIETDDRAAMCEELGDVLLQVMFHSRIAQEDPVDPWSVDDVAAAIAAKLIARHPHVFGDEHVDSAAHVEAVWQARKALEKSRDSVLDGLPSDLPALSLATKMTHRAANGGITAPAGSEVVQAAALTALEAVGAEQFGSLLLALAVAGQERGHDAEAELRHALRGYAERIRSAETA
ncbi:MAG: MazG family protein [Candidatus Nanopelagicales bacterium]